MGPGFPPSGAPGKPGGAWLLARRFTGTRVAFGIAASLILGSNLLVWASQRPVEEAATVPAGLESWTTGLEVTSRTASLTTGELLTYFQVREKG